MTTSFCNEYKVSINKIQIILHRISLLLSGHWICCAAQLVFYKIGLFSPNWNVDKVSKVARMYIFSKQGPEIDMWGL